MECTLYRYEIHPFALLWNPNSVSSSGRLTSPGVEITLISNIIRSTRRLPVDWIKLSLMKFDTTLNYTDSATHTCKCILHDIRIQGWRNRVYTLQNRVLRLVQPTHRALLQQNENRSHQQQNHFIRALAAAPGATMRRRLAEKRNFLINEAETRWCGGGWDSAFREQRNGRRKRSVLFSDSLSSLFHERAR